MKIEKERQLKAVVLYLILSHECHLESVFFPALLFYSHHLSIFLFMGRKDMFDNLFGDTERMKERTKE